MKKPNHQYKNSHSQNYSQLPITQPCRKLIKTNTSTNFDIHPTTSGTFQKTQFVHSTGKQNILDNLSDEQEDFIILEDEERKYIPQDTLRILTYQDKLLKSKKINNTNSFEFELKMFNMPQQTIQSGNIWSFSAKSLSLSNKLFVNKVEAINFYLKDVELNIQQMKNIKLKKIQKPELFKPLNRQHLEVELQKTDLLEDLQQLFKFGRQSIDGNLKAKEIQKAWYPFMVVNPLVYQAEFESNRHKYFTQIQTINEQLEICFENAQDEISSGQGMRREVSFHSDSMWQNSMSLQGLRSTNFNFLSQWTKLFDYSAWRFGQKPQIRQYQVVRNQVNNIQIQNFQPTQNIESQFGHQTINANNINYTLLSSPNNHGFSIIDLFQNQNKNSQIQISQYQSVLNHQNCKVKLGKLRKSLYLKNLNHKQLPPNLQSFYKKIHQNRKQRLGQQPDYQKPQHSFRKNTHHRVQPEQQMFQQNQKQQSSSKHVLRPILYSKKHQNSFSPLSSKKYRAGSKSKRINALYHNQEPNILRFSQLKTGFKNLQLDLSYSKRCQEPYRSSPKRWSLFRLQNGQPFEDQSTRISNNNLTEKAEKYVRDLQNRNFLPKQKINQSEIIRSQRVYWQFLNKYQKNQQHYSPLNTKSQDQNRCKNYFYCSQNFNTYEQYPSDINDEEYKSHDIQNIELIDNPEIDDPECIFNKKSLIDNALIPNQYQRSKQLKFKKSGAIEDSPLLQIIRMKQQEQLANILDLSSERNEQINSLSDNQKGMPETMMDQIFKYNKPDEHMISNFQSKRTMREYMDLIKSQITQSNVTCLNKLHAKFSKTMTRNLIFVAMVHLASQREFPYRLLAQNSDVKLIPIRQDHQKPQPFPKHQTLHF